MLDVERRGRVAILRFDRGDGRNALSLEALRVLRDAFDAIQNEEEPPTAVILTGAASTFSVGFDLKDPAVSEIRQPGIRQRLRGPQLGAAACRALAGLEAYTIVAIEGWCLGGGLAIALCGDLIVAGREARFALPEIDRGMNLSWSALPRLISKIGPGAAKRLAILGEKLDADAAAKAGLVDEVVAEGGAFDRAQQLAEVAAEKPPLAVRMIKRGANAYTEAAIAGAAALDAEQFALASLSEDFTESLEAFRDKRPPRYTGK